MITMTARREVGKWLNEQPNRKIDRGTLVDLCAEYDRRQWARAWKSSITTGKPFDEIIDGMAQ